MRLHVFSYFVCGTNLDNFHVDGIKPFLAVLNFKRYLIVFTDLVNETGNVNEDVLTAIGRLNESKALCFVKELYCTFLHC